MRSLALVAGAAGQLGAAIAEGLSRDHEVVPMTRAELDISDLHATLDTVRGVYPDIIVNCAAYNAVDAAEEHPLDALSANAWGVRALARAATEISATLIHYSTDFVFDGAASRPYTEADQPNPRSTYAMSKLLGEWFAIEAPQHYVLRVESLFGGPQARSSVDRMLAAIRAGQAVRAFADRTVTPSYVEDVVRATSLLIAHGSPYGLYHCVNSGTTNWAELARELARLAGRPDARIVEVPMADAGLTATRPTYAALSNAKLARAGIEMPSWQSALARYVASPG